METKNLPFWHDQRGFINAFGLHFFTRYYFTCIIIITNGLNELFIKIFFHLHLYIHLIFNYILLLL
ncbi:hypothetical protein Hanom_Chr09g00861961 [Helianthus anomalus]